MAAFLIHFSIPSHQSLSRTWNSKYLPSNILPHHAIQTIQNKHQNNQPASRSKAVAGDRKLASVIFLRAGSETSSTTLEWAISETLKDPRILKRAQEEVRSKFDDLGNVVESNNFSTSTVLDLKYLEAIVKQTLRLHPSVPLLLPRESNEHCKINGYDIPAKTRVIVNAWAIGRDSNFWNDESEVFKPERFLDLEVDFIKGNHFQYIPFDGGRRICPGISFGLANIMLPLAQLLFHFDWKLRKNGSIGYGRKHGCLRKA